MVLCAEELGVGDGVVFDGAGVRVGRIRGVLDAEGALVEMMGALAAGLDTRALDSGTWTLDGIGALLLEGAEALWCSAMTLG